MVILFALLLQVLPEKELLTYETIDKGKIGSISVVSELKDGYRVVYTSDRYIEVLLDSLDLSTLQVEKLIDDKRVLEVRQEDDFVVRLRGNRYRYREKGPVYDRHTLDFALRGFFYHDTFKKTFRLHVPEFMIVNAELEVLSEDVVSGPLGDIRCWKLMMKPRVLFFNWKFYFWIERAYPHRFIKFEDSSGENGIHLIEYERASGL